MRMKLMFDKPACRCTANGFSDGTHRAVKRNTRPYDSQCRIFSATTKILTVELKGGQYVTIWPALMPCALCIFTTTATLPMFLDS